MQSILNYCGLSSIVYAPFQTPLLNTMQPFEFFPRSYFDQSSGIGFNLGRVNLDSCDFSPRTYSYVETPGDVSLDTFQLQEEDTIYKVSRQLLTSSIFTQIISL